MKAGILSLAPDLPKHPQHRLVGAAVQRPVERRDGGGRRGIRIRLRGPDAAHGRRRAVLLVVGVQDEEHLERALQHRVHLVARSPTWNIICRKLPQ